MSSRGMRTFLSGQLVSRPDTANKGVELVGGKERGMNFAVLRGRIRAEVVWIARAKRWKRREERRGA